MVMLSHDLDDPNARPYFLWNEDTTVGRLREILGDPTEPARPLYAARLMREARVVDVWRFLTPREVAGMWEQVQFHLGKRRAFWRYLLDVWGRHGAL